MPHDRKGQELKIGDTVNIPAVVTNITMTEDYCNVSLESVEVFHPSAAKSYFSINASQTEKV